MLGKSDDFYVPFSGCESIAQPQVESAEGNLPQLLTDPYVNISAHATRGIQPSTSMLASEIFENIALSAILLNALYAVLDFAFTSRSPHEFLINVIVNSRH